RWDPSALRVRWHPLSGPVSEPARPRLPVCRQRQAFSKFVWMFLASTVHRGFGPLSAMAAYWGFLKFIGKAAIGARGDFLTTDDSSAPMIEAIRSRLAGLNCADTERLVSRLAEAGFDFEEMPYDFFLIDEERVASLLDFLSLDPDLLSGLDEADQGLLSASGGDEGYLSLREGYRVDETA